MPATNTPSILSLLKQANDELRDGNFDLTIHLCTQVLDSSSLSFVNKTEALKARGKAYKYKHDFKSALADYDALVGMYPHSPNSYANRAWVHILINEGASLIKGISDLVKCQEECDDPDDPRIDQIFHLLFSYHSKSQILDAIKCLPDKQKVEALLKDCLDKKKHTYFGRYFWAAKGLRECHPDRGTLADIGVYLQELATYTQEDWFAVGKVAHTYDNFFGAIQAYSAALFLGSDHKLKSTLHLASGDAWAGLGWRREAVADYHEAIKYNNQSGEGYVKRALILSDSGHLKDIKQCINYLEDIYAKLAEGSLQLNSKEKRWLDLCVANLFEKHKKTTVFEAIKLFKPTRQINLLEACLSKDHYLGRFFWKNRYPFTHCRLESGVLAKIVAHLNVLRGDNAPTLVPVSVNGLFGRDENMLELALVDSAACSSSESRKLSSVS